MGYSYAAKAGYVLDAIVEQVGGEISNGMPDGGFWEHGREQYDGAITGTVWTPATDPDLPGYVNKRGGFRIEPDGKITRFPGLDKKFRELAEVRGLEKYQSIHEYVEAFQWKKK